MKHAAFQLGRVLNDVIEPIFLMKCLRSAQLRLAKNSLKMAHVKLRTSLEASVVRKVQSVIKNEKNSRELRHQKGARDQFSKSCVHAHV